MKEAQLYTRLKNLQVHCQLCAHSCKIPEGKFGFCGVRQNISGILYTHNYAKLVAANIDPVEKKPLYHFLPGTSTFSIASAGCNFRCGFCQNWQISQVDFNHQQPPPEDFSADKVVKLAQQNNCKSIAYTYTEPTIYFEFALETAKLAKEASLRNIFVTNGYMSQKTVSLLSPYLDAANIDLKFFKESSYQRICSAKLGPVLDSIQLLNAAGVWIEITTLIIPGVNDTPGELTAIAKFIAAVNKDIPWHISRFHADYKFKDYAPTPERTLKLAYDLGISQGLHYVYVGNFGAWGQDTLCARCRRLLIKRDGFNILESNLAQNRCVFCQTALPGVFN
ncbi:MAG: AmmeMemoRadiSam system radical SAM enzyme [Candidatus Omnitrophica bacterium]|nr:AmmeMemoRadiSam system radical SAM enzyme [Candidatus Omnitrophota bacterium]MBU4303675.1 AmmeMemoRadiSam system radical SAM enzyme [Candidatus Omnitrophota bacterium]MBU4419172.1 AmmeMemoRadiSam system radical SAM enzyme [Candidatus Omnitrophota bacterium]MBU4467295.1 AmmeMemoRadiSam system radical SAM enzyme [Candidatus Omnitrophota bacterium]MCG2708285.1 AmmeMemoRadiSam system radical SAM enzyme [Candidatus Omnitrophota bacterium]